MRSGDWWWALPDVPAAETAESLLRTVGQVLAQHPSGRPWIVGRHRPATIRLVQFGVTRAAVLGECLAGDQQLAATTGRGIEHLMSLPGSFHAVVAAPAGLVAAGDIAGFRRLFTTNAHDVPVVASHAHVLRSVVGASVERVWLACTLASSEMPSVLRDTLSPFAGISPVPAGSRVEITVERTSVHCRTSRWWTPPPADRALTAGAVALREALTSAVTGRISRAGGPVSVQLSGGLDSTALAALAHPVRPLLITTAGRSPIEDDLLWAQRAAQRLPHGTHRIIGAEEAPLFFADLDTPVPGTDEPAPFTAGAARQRYAAELLAGYGTACHLNGQGGDEVLLAPLAYLRPALRAVPRTGWRHLRGHAALRGIRLPVMVRALARHESFAAWLRRSAATLRTAPAPAADGVTGWEAPPVLPPWATGQAAELVASAILAAAPTPVAGDQATHAALVRIRASAYAAGLYRDAMTAAGVPTAMPFFDRAVVEACLSTRPWERTDPWRPKPLLRAALAPTVPANLLCRKTKSDYNTDILHGWGAHRDRLADLLGRPRLAEYGLVDPIRLRHALAAFGPSGLPPAWVTDLIAVETWLRDLDRDRVPSVHHPGGPMPLTFPRRPRPKARPPVRLARTVQVTPVDDGAVLLDIRRGTLYHVNRAGAVALTALADESAAAETSNAASTVAAIDSAAAALITRYGGITEDRARADVAALLDQLGERKLLAR